MHELRRRRLDARQRGRPLIPRDVALNGLADAVERWLDVHQSATLHDLGRKEIAEARYEDVGDVDALDKYMDYHSITTEVEDGQTGTIMRCNCRVGRPSHPCLVRFDRAVA